MGKTLHISGKVLDNEVSSKNIKFLTSSNVDIPTKVEDDFSQKSWPPTRWSQHHAKSQVNSSDFKSEFHIDFHYGRAKLIQWLNDSMINDSVINDSMMQWSMIRWLNDSMINAAAGSSRERQRRGEDNWWFGCGQWSMGQFWKNIPDSWALFWWDSFPSLILFCFIIGRSEIGMILK